MVSGLENKVDEIYYELAVDNLKNRNIVVPASKLKNFIQPTKVVYRSVYGFENTIVDHFTIYKTVKSFKGKCYIKTLVFDVDVHEELNDRVELTYDMKVEALKVGIHKTKELIRQLAEMTGASEYSIPIWYSGRGFHLQTPDFFNFKPSTYLREEVASTMKHYFPTIDHKPYMTSGLIRMNYSYHDKARSYKVPLYYDELSDIHGILEKAKYQRGTDGNFHKVEWEEWDSWDLSDKIIVPTEKAKHEVNKYNVTRIVTCVQKMFKEGPIVGSRNNVLLRMLTSWRKQGLTYEQSFVLAREWFQGEWSDYQIENQVNFVWKNAYTAYKCTDEVMAKYCDYNCIYYKAKNYNITIADNLSIEQELKESLKNAEDPNSVTFDLAPIFKLPVECKFYEGNAILLFGYPKIGKSFLMQFIAQKAKKKTLYYTLEMPNREIYHRQLMISLKETEDEIANRLVERNEELHENVSHITFIEESPTLLDIQSHIDQLEPDWVVIDTLDGILEDSFKGSETLRLAHIIQKLKQLAIQRKIVIFVIQHVNNKLDDKGKLKPLGMFSGLYSSEGARKFDKVLGWEGYHEDTRRVLRSLALRKGKHFEKVIHFSEDTSSLIPE